MSKTAISTRLLFFGTGRGSQHLLDTPARLQSAVQGNKANACFLRPFHQTHCPSVVRNQMICTLISGLLLWGGPAAVARFVITVVVNAVNGMFRRRLWPHVSKEIDEGLQPAVAHYNIAPTIPVVAAITRVAASFTHSCPRIPFRRPRHSVAGTCAPSTLGASTTSKIGSDNWLLRSAFAAAEPFDRPAIIVRMKLKNRPFPKCLASQVYKAGMSFGRIAVSHDRTPFTGLVRTARRFLPSGCSHYTTGRMGDVAHAT